MATVTIREARQRFSDLIKAAERGESITITRRGRRVAQLVPAREPAAKGLPDLSAFRASLKVKGKALSSMVIEQRSAERG